MPLIVAFEVLLIALIATAPEASMTSPMNVLMIAVDDLRPMFGASYGTEEVLTPAIDKFFMDGGGSAMQHSYVQIAICGPSRASILTGRRCVRACTPASSAHPCAQPA